jgi:hypothetical protein
MKATYAGWLSFYTFTLNKIQFIHLATKLLGFMLFVLKQEKLCLISS